MVRFERLRRDQTDSSFPVTLTYASAHPSSLNTSPAHPGEV